MIEDNTGHIQPMEDDALTEDDEVLALNVLESEDHTEDEQILTQHVILEQEDKTPSPMATKLSSVVTKLSAFSTSSSSSSSSSSSTANLISGGTQGAATVSTRVQVDTALAQVQVSDTTHPFSNDERRATNDHASNPGSNPPSTGAAFCPWDW